MPPHQLVRAESVRQGLEAAACLGRSDGSLLDGDGIQNGRCGAGYHALCIQAARSSRLRTLSVVSYLVLLRVVLSMLKSL